MKKALIIIDVQKGFINKLTKPIVIKIRKYILKTNNHYDLLIFTQYFNRKGSNFIRSLKWSGFMDKNQTDLADEIKELINGNHLFPKFTYSSFVDNKLFSLLKKNKIDQVELAGFDTENCVLTFARDAFDRGMSVLVLKNLTASHSSPRLHKAALEIIKHNIGIIK
ncbi:MAG: isochorismatase family cysteine hydrolase [Patescibacteria group bacterium]